LVFLTAFNELTVSALLWSSGLETLGVVVFSFQQGGDSTYAAAVATLTVAVTAGLMLATLLVAHRLPRGVLPWRDQPPSPMGGVARVGRGGGGGAGRAGGGGGVVRR